MTIYEMCDFCTDNAKINKMSKSNKLLITDEESVTHEVNDALE